MLYWGANFLTGNDIFSKDNAIYARYKNLDGLTSSNAVHFMGAPVGSVKTVEYDSTATDGFCWVVGFEITTPGIILKDSCIAEIASADLFTMVIKMSDIHKGNKTVQPGDTLIGKLSLSLQKEIDKRLAPLEKKVNDLVSKADTLINTFVTVLDDKTQNNIKRSFEQIPAAIANILNATRSLDSITTDLKNAKVERIVDHIESLTKTLNNNSGKITSIIENLDNITDSLAQTNVKQTVARVEAVLAETETIMSKINNGEGTVGKLLNDQELYEHLVLASADLDFLLLDLKQNPGRYLNLSLFNFGSKRKKDANAWDTADYKVLQDNLITVDALSNEALSDLAKEIRDSCGTTPCDSAKLRRILEKY